MSPMSRYQAEWGSLQCLPFRLPKVPPKSVIEFVSCFRFPGSPEIIWGRVGGGKGIREGRKLRDKGRVTSAPELGPSCCPLPVAVGLDPVAP